MARATLTGSRIREQRVAMGLKQQELAAKTGISASYLNLIEHNRRRIGGKILLDIAQALSVEPQLLSEGAEATLLEALRLAAVEDTADAGPELDQIDEFAGRFPGWARLAAAQKARLDGLERSLETLNDRVAHDPNLAASLHEMLTTVTSIRSTAAILAEPGELDPQWRARFDRNINEDSRRLAESSRNLAAYLEVSEQTENLGTTTAQDEMDQLFLREGYHFPALERNAANPEAEINLLLEPLSVSARHIARTALKQYAEDATFAPYDVLTAAMKSHGPNPSLIARHFGIDLSRAMRRMATVPEGDGAGPLGLVVCDTSGTVIFRRELRGFPIPRFGAACPLWPLYQALTRPASPVVSHLRMAGRDPFRFRAYANAQPMGQAGFDRQVLVQATMLVVPDHDDAFADDAIEVGPSCRICPRTPCYGRREPSILSQGF